MMYIGGDALRQRFHASYVLDGEDEVVECGIADEGSRWRWPVDDARPSALEVTASKEEERQRKRTQQQQAEESRPKKKAAVEEAPPVEEATLASAARGRGRSMAMQQKDDERRGKAKGNKKTKKSQWDLLQPRKKQQARVWDAKEGEFRNEENEELEGCLLYTSPSPRD